MKKMLIFLPILLFLIACRKSSGNTNIQAYIKYKLNGVQVQINDTMPINLRLYYGSFTAQKLSSSSLLPTRYDFNAQKGNDSSSFEISFPIFSDSLKSQNYHYDSTSLSHYITSNVNYPFAIGFSQAGKLSYMFYNGDYYDVNITSYSGGRISGNFTAKASPAPSASINPVYATRGTTIITEGTFENVEVTY